MLSSRNAVLIVWMITFLGGATAWSPRCSRVRRIPLALVSSTANSASTTPGPKRQLPDSAIYQARNNALTLAKTLAEESVTGVFISNPASKSDLKKAIAELEALAPKTTDRDRQLLVGDWTLICTTNVPSRGSSDPQMKLPFNLPRLTALQDSIRTSFDVTQSIRKTASYSDTIDRVDNVIEYSPLNTLKSLIGESSTFKGLRDLNVNPLEVSKSKVSLIHSAEVTSLSPVFRTKIALKSIVWSVAGTSQYLDPEGADILNMNVPLGEFLNSGSFDTTYIDEKVRISRGTAGFLDELRVFIRKGFTVEDTLMEDMYEADMMSKEDPPSARDQAERVSNKVVDVVDKAERSVKNISNELNKDVREVSDTIEKNVKDVRDVVSKNTRDVADSIEKDAKDVRATVNRDAREVIDLAEKDADDVRATVNRDALEVTDLAEKDADDVRSILNRDAREISDSVEQDANDVRATLNRDAREIADLAEKDVIDVRAAVNKDAKETVDLIEKDVTDVRATLNRDAQDVADSVKERKNVRDTVNKDAREAADLVERDVKDVRTALNRDARDVADSVEKDVKDVSSTVNKDAQDIADSMEKNFKNARDTVETDVQEVSNVVEKDIDDVSNVIQKDAQDVADTVEKDIDDVSNVIQKNVQDVADTVEKNLNDASDETKKDSRGFK